MTDRELMQMANRIEALAFEMKAPNAHTPQFVMLANEIRARARLAQPEPEPVAWMHPDGRIWTFGRGFDKSTFTIPLYTAPPQREWQGLTDEEMMMIYGQSHEGKKYSLGRAIEAKLKGKNA